MSEIPKQLDFSKSEKVCPKYRYHKITPQGDQTITISGAEQNSVFNLPADVFNFNGSYLTFDVATIAAPGANTQTWINADNMPFIKQLIISSRSGERILDCNHFGHFTKIVWPTTKKLNELKAIPLNVVTDNVVDAGELAVATSISGLMASGVRRGLNYRRNGIAAAVSFASADSIEYRQLMYAGNNATTPVLTYIMDLGSLAYTICEKDMDLFFNEILEMTIVWNVKNNISWKATVTAAPPIIRSPATGPVAGGDITVNNIAFYLKTEMDQEIITNIKQSVIEGTYNIVYDYPVNYKRLIAAAVQQSVNYEFSGTRGLRLKKIFHSAFSGTEGTGLHLAFDNSAISSANAEDQKIITFYTSLDGKRLQDFDIDTSKWQDYMMLQDKLKDTAIFNSNIHHSNWFWLDDFTGSDSLVAEKSQNEICGLPLRGNVIWEFNSTTSGAALTHYTFFIFQKLLTVTPSGIVVNQ